MLVTKLVAVLKARSGVVLPIGLGIEGQPQLQALQGIDGEHASRLKASTAPA